MALDEDPIFTNVSASVNHLSNSEEGDDNARTVPPTTATASGDSMDDDDINLDSESLAEFQRELRDQRRERERLRESLARAEITHLNYWKNWIGNGPNMLQKRPNIQIKRMLYSKKAIDYALSMM
jgi:hypothetical protein